MIPLSEAPGLDRPRLLHALQLAVAAILAFAIACTFHVQNAYWAVMPVFVVAQPTRGLIFERGALRFLGTLIGAGFGLALLAAPLHPLAMLAVLGLWTGLNAGLGQMLRGTHGYAPLLAGMTAAVVVLPSLFSPEQGVGLALARAECTMIGVVVATIVIGLTTPPAARDAFYRDVGEAALDVLRLSAAMLRQGEGTAQAEHALMRRLAQLQERGALVTAASPRGYRRLHHFNALLVSALGLLGASRSVPHRQPAEAARLAALCEANAAAPAGQEPASVGPSDGPDGFEQALSRFLVARATFDADDGDALTAFGLRLAPHFDRPVALFTAILAGSATFLSAAPGVLLHWPLAELTALGVCIFSMVLGSLPKPHAVVPIMARGVVVGVAVATLYRFGIQPYAQTLPALILSLAPFLLIGSLARASARFGPPALDANMCFLLASQAGNMEPAPAGEILGGSLALLLAIAVVALVVRWLPDPARHRARNAATAIRKDLAALASGKPVDAAEMRDRASRALMRLALHLGQGETEAGTGRSPIALYEAGTLLRRLSTRRADDAAPAARQRIDKALDLVRSGLEHPDELARALPALAAGGTDGIARDLRDLAQALDDGAALIATR